MNIEKSNQTQTQTKINHLLSEQELLLKLETHIKSTSSTIINKSLSLIIELKESLYNYFLLPSTASKLKKKKHLDIKYSIQIGLVEIFNLN
jgi:hypothetical protein